MLRGTTGASQLGRAAYLIQQALNLGISVSAVALVIAGWLELSRQIGNYEAAGGHPDGDVVRGPALVIFASLVAGLFALGAFLLLRFGRPWGSVLGILMWLVLWWPARINLNAYFPNTGFVISTLVCGLGCLLAAVTFFALRAALRSPER